MMGQAMEKSSSERGKGYIAQLGNHDGPSDGEKLLWRVENHGS